MHKKHQFLLLLALVVLPLLSNAQQIKLKADLDPLISLPGAYSLTPEKLNELFPKKKFNKNPYFQWLDQDKTRAIFKRKPAGNVFVNLNVLEGSVPIHEMIVDFKDGKYLGVIVSIYNRGDATGKMSKADFDSSVKGLGRHLGIQLDTRPHRRKGKGLLTNGYSWFSTRGMAVLEYNPDAENSKVEFVRMRLCRRDAKGSYAAALKERPAPAVRTSSLPINVEKTADGNVFIDNIPMVDQGGKGYCVVASVQRVFEYFGVPCDMHQLAEIVDADPEIGTNSIKTAKELGDIDHLFRMRYEVLALRHNRKLIEPIEKDGNFYVGDDTLTSRDFGKVIRKYVDKGIPILWAMNLGEAPEEPAISQQASGGHMRLIIGYNDKTERLLFSDSWGAGHEVKSMLEKDAMSVTKGIYLMKPINN